MFVTLCFNDDAGETVLPQKILDDVYAELSCSALRAVSTLSFHLLVLLNNKSI